MQCDKKVDRKILRDLNTPIMCYTRHADANPLAFDRLEIMPNFELFDITEVNTYDTGNTHWLIIHWIGRTIAHRAHVLYFYPTLNKILSYLVLNPKPYFDYSQLEYAVCIMAVILFRLQCTKLPVTISPWSVGEREVRAHERFCSSRNRCGHASSQ